MGMQVMICTPKSYMPDADIVRYAEETAATTGGCIELVHDPRTAAQGADVVYTDVWVSMGQEAEQTARNQAFAGFRVDAELMTAAKHDAIVMHCLPAHRGEEITADVLEGPQSVVFDQAENRLHAQKAIMATLMR